MLSLLKNPIVYIFVLFIACAGLTVMWVNSRSEVSGLRGILEQRVTELQRANLELGRAETRIGDANLMIEKLNKQVQEEIKKNQAALRLYAELEALYETEKQKVKIITKIVYKDREIPIPAGKIFVKLDDGTYQEVSSMKFGYNDFRINITGDAIKQELSYKLHQKFRIIFVESQLPTGDRNHYAELYEIDEQGKDVGKLTLTNFKVIRSEELKPKMMWWNPKLDLNLGYTFSPKGLDHGWSGTVGLSFSAYGATPDDISWRFFRFGVGISQSAALLDFSPFQYNVGKKLPLISNLWIGPSVGVILNSEKKAITIGTGIGVVF